MAGNAEMIDQIVSKGALDSLDTLNTKLTSSYTEMEKLLSKVQVLSNELTKPAKAYIELSKLTEDQKKLEQDLAKALENHAKLEKELNELKQKTIQTNSKEVESIQQVSKAYTDNSKAIADNGKTLKDISTEAYNMASKNIDNNRKTLVSLQIELKATQGQLSQLDDQYKKNLITETEYINRKTALIGKEQEQKATVKTLSDSIKYENQIISTTIGSYDNLSAQYSRIKIQINQMSDAEKYNGYSKAELEAQSKSLYEEMSRLQKVTGKNQLDVGKYDIAVKDLTKTLSIIDPRIGMLMTKLQNISPLKNTWLKVNDKLVTSLGLSAKAATILQAAVLGLVIGGILLAVDAYKQWQEESEKTAKKQREQQDAVAESISSVIISYKSLQKQWNELGDSLDERKKFLSEHRSELDNTGISINNVNDAEKVFVSNTEAVITAIKLRAEAQVLEKLSAEKLEEAIKTENEAWERYLNPTFSDQAKATADNFVTFFDNAANTIAGGTKKAYSSSLDFSRQASLGMLDDAKKAHSESDKLLDQSIERRKQASELVSKLNLSTTTEEKKVKTTKNRELEKQAEAERKAAIDLAELKKKIEADAQKTILADNKMSYDERMQAANEFENKMTESINDRLNEQLKDEKLTKSQIEFLELKAQEERNKIADEGSKYRENILKDYIERQKKIIEDAYSDRLDILSSGEQEELSKLADQYAKSELSQKEYEEKKLQTTKEYAKARFDAEIDSLRQMLDVSQITEEQKAEIEKKIRDSELKYNQSINDQKIKSDEDSAKQRADIEKKLAEKRKEIIQQLAEESLNLLTAIWDAETERNLAKLEKQSEDNQNWRDEELERIERLEESGAISKEQADARKELVEQQAKERERLIEEEKKKAQIEQAKRDKLIAIAMAGINTAKAITAVLPNFVLAALVGALGAIQIGTILATPIPQYEKGTDGHIGGPAIVGEKRHEMIITPDGSIFKTPNIPTVMNLPKDTIVLPDYSEALLRMNMNILPKERADGVTIFESVKQLEEIKGLKGNVARMNRSNNMGNEAIQRELIQINRRLGRQSLDNSINRRKMNN